MQWIILKTNTQFVRSHDSAVIELLPQQPPPPVRLLSIACKLFAHVFPGAISLARLHRLPPTWKCVFGARIQHGAGISGGAANSPPRDQDEIRVTAFCLFPSFLKPTSRSPTASSQTLVCFYRVVTDSHTFNAACLLSAVFLSNYARKCQPLWC